MSSVSKGRREPIVVDQPAGPVEGCTHRVQHQHGVYATYVSNCCRCKEFCLPANRRYGADVRSRHRIGGPVRTRPNSRTARREAARRADDVTPLGLDSDQIRQARLIAAAHATSKEELETFLTQLGLHPNQIGADA